MNKLSLIQQIQRFFKLESAGGILLLFSAVVAMLLANSPLNQTYNDFLNLPVSIQVGSFSIDKTLIHWINDGFMAVFFVLVGMEVKKELFEGSLSSYQQAIFPAIAAVGGNDYSCISLCIYHPTRSRFSRRLGYSNGNRHCLCTWNHGVIK